MKTMVLCNRVADETTALVPDSVMLKCEACGHNCWVSPATVATMAELDAPAIVCTQCCLENLPPEGLELMLTTEGQKAEIRAAGHEPDELPDGIWLRPARGKR